MNRHQHVSNNDVLGAPPGMTTDECVALPVTRVRFPDGLPGVMSFWMPTPIELALLNSGKPVRFTIVGSTHAPIMIGVDGDMCMAPIS